MAKTNLGVIGLGTVGTGVLKLLANDKRFKIKWTAVRDLSKPRAIDLSTTQVTNNPFEIINDPEVEIVVEVAGGVEPFYALTKQAIALGKHIVTANKELIAKHGSEIFDLANKHNVTVMFEAAVGGGIPLISTLQRGLQANEISSVAGILNGTTNFILTAMQEKGQSFADALRDAQKLGYAEADPTFDIEGLDAAHKLTILASIAFGMPLDTRSVAVEGITKVTPQDIQIAQVLGYRIKLLGIAKRGAQGAVELRVHPTLIPETTLLAKVDGVLNSVLIRGNAVGEVGLYGRGAGGDATASAVIADLVDVARSLGAGARHAVPSLAFQPDAVQPLPVVPMSDVASAFYLRLKVADEAGVLSKLTAILAAHDISVEAILQREPHGREDAHVALITSVVRQARFDHALVEMLGLPFVREGAAVLRVEKFD